ncbi:MAG: SLBB domain-containing protein [Bacteroidia bacterium]|nr:SLBB domain-containing protein [Bacteroidia bacterium]
MRENHYLSRIFLITIWTFFPILIFAQTPAGSTNLSSSELLEIQNRVEEMRRAGIPESRIIEILQEELPAQNPAPATSAPAPRPTPESPEPTVAPSPQQIAPPKPLEAEDIVNLDPTPDKMGTYEPSGIFGHSVFLSQPQGESPVRLTPPSNYLIGPGDVFTVSIYGPSEKFESLAVMNDGAITRQFFGKIYLAGMRYQDAHDLLVQKYKGLVDNRATIEISLTPNPRTIGINIVGEVGNPGYYQIPASLPAFRAIIQAGGITDIGTVRNIQVKRNGRIVHTIDIYEYLLSGSYQPFYLQEDDFIFVPISSKVVEIAGAVARPMKYELKENENLNMLIAFSGGLIYTAQTKNVELKRLETVPSTSVAGPATEKKELILNLNLDQIAKSPIGDYQLFDGDKLAIKSLKKELYNSITIQGSVEYPDTYQLFEGERLTDLIERAGGLSPDAYLDRAYIVRRDLVKAETEYIPVNLRAIFPDSAQVIKSSAENVELQFNDAVILFSQNTFRETRSLTAIGRIKRPGTFRIYPGMNLRDLLFLVGGFQPDAEINSIELSFVSGPEDVDIANFSLDESGDPQTGKPTAGDENPADTTEAALIRRISVPQNWQESQALDTIMIYDFNRIKVYSKYDFVFTRQVSVGGAVKNSGSFPVKRGMTLTDVLYQAGGLTEPAALNVVELHKIIEVQDKGNFGTKTKEAEIERIQLKGDWRENSLADSIDITQYYRVVVRSESEFVRKGYLEVKGLVGKPGTYEVVPGMSLKDVIYMAGGLMLESNVQQIELSRIIDVVGQDGEIVPIPTNIKIITTEQDWESDSSLNNIKIFTFDQIFVRPDPNFNLQENVYVRGEITTEGEYSKNAKDERLSSLVARANGITKLSYLKGAYLIREGVGEMSIKLDKALRRQGSKYDLRLVKGDVLVIPARTDAVTITGNVLAPGTTVMFEQGNRRMKYYVGLAGGFARKTRKRECTVQYVDGRVKRTKRFFFLRFYPKVDQGAVIQIPSRSPKEDNKEEKQRKSWDFQPEEIISAAVTIITFYLLLDRAVN